MLCPMPTSGRGIWSLFKFIIWRRSREWSIQLGSLPRRSSFRIPLWPCCATSAIQMLLIRNLRFARRFCRSSHNGSYSSFGKPHACAPIMVISPGWGVGLSIGMYCFTARWRISSCSWSVALGYSRICWVGTLCSTILKRVADILAANEN